MPKPQFPRFAARYKGLKIGRIIRYKRFYIRKNGRFIPTGWEVTYQQWDLGTTVKKYFSDSELTED